ncbi:hypothetical protein DV872_25090 [Oceanispirochaeta sp. M1]|nr:hypothetical protein DV872_25090 [Oceanispirochaeta sp. M1]
MGGYYIFKLDSFKILSRIIILLRIPVFYLSISLILHEKKDFSEALPEKRSYPSKRIAGDH